MLYIYMLYKNPQTPKKNPVMLYKYMLFFHIFWKKVTYIKAKNEWLYILSFWCVWVLIKNGLTLRQRRRRWPSVAPASLVSWVRSCPGCGAVSGVYAVQSDCHWAVMDVGRQHTACLCYPLIRWPPWATLSDQCSPSNPGLPLNTPPSPLEKMSKAVPMV